MALRKKNYNNYCPGLGRRSNISHNYHHIVQSMVYFEDADEDKMPPLNFKVTWPEIKQYFEREVPRVLKELIRLGE